MFVETPNLRQYPAVYGAKNPYLVLILKGRSILSLLNISITLIKEIMIIINITSLNVKLHPFPECSRV